MTTFSRGTNTGGVRKSQSINLANNYALYNFLSTFSGTHYVTPRTIAATDRIPLLDRG